MHNAHRSSLFHDTASKNIVLLIPALAIMDNMWGLTGVIAYYCSIELFILSDQYKKTKVVKQISALKQGTYLIGLNYPTVLQLIDYIQRTCHWQLLLHTLVSKKE